jgi:hypothetical protein
MTTPTPPVVPVQQTERIQIVDILARLRPVWHPARQYDDFQPPDSGHSLSGGPGNALVRPCC